MLEQVAAEIEAHIQVELGVHVVLEHIQKIDHERHDQAADDDQGQQDRAVAPPGPREDRWDRLAPQNVIHQDLERPGREQAGRDAGDGDDHRADGQLPVRSQVVEDSPEVGHDSSRQRATPVRCGDEIIMRPDVLVHRGSLLRRRSSGDWTRQLVASDLDSRQPRRVISPGVEPELILGITVDGGLLMRGVG